MLCEQLEIFQGRDSLAKFIRQRMELCGPQDRNLICVFQTSLSLLSSWNPLLPQPSFAFKLVKKSAFFLYMGGHCRWGPAQADLPEKSCLKIPPLCCFDQERPKQGPWCARPGLIYAC